MTRPRLSPRSEAIAYRAAMWCRDHGWEHDTQQIADGIGETQQAVQRVFVLKGWMPRVRKLTVSHEHTHYSRAAGEGQLEELSSWA